MKAFGWQVLKSSVRSRVAVVIFIAPAVCCLAFWRMMTVSDVGPTWRGITVGQSTADDVVAKLGTPTSIEQRSGQTVYSYQEGRFDYNMHHIIIRDGVIEYIEEDALAYSYNIRLAQLVSEYGTPDCVLWSKESPGDRIAVFLGKGIFVRATFFSSLNKAQVIRIVYYRPCSIVRLLLDFGDMISVVNPFPDSDVIGPRDPWFKTSWLTVFLLP
jgi:hypothetical protein